MEIHTETPKEGRPLTKVFSKPAIDRMYASLMKMGREYNIDFNVNEYLSNSHLALATGEFSKEAGKFSEFHESAFREYFNKGKDIGDINIILDICKELSMDTDELIKKLEVGYYDKSLADVLHWSHSNSINSIPTFIIDDEYEIVGSQPIAAFRSLLNKIEKDSETK